MKTFIFLFAIFSSTVSFSQLSVSSNHDLQSYLDEILGPGVTLVNAQYHGSPSAIGIFDGSQTNIGLNSGVLMTTGDVTDTINGPYGPNDSGSTSVDNNQPGSALIDNLAGHSSYNASIIEMDIIPHDDTLYLEYVFGSEEYPEYVCAGFNDAFGFFLNGPNPNGGTYNNYNIPLIPGTTIPVSINTVNNGTVGSQGDITNCTTSGLSNSQFYVANDSGITIQYDGFTTPISAYANVQCGETYKIILAIADVADGIYDSGIFLKSHSLRTIHPINLSIHENGNVANNNIVVYTPSSVDSVYKDFYLINNSSSEMKFALSRNTLFNYPVWADAICVDSICMSTGSAQTWTQPSNINIQIPSGDSVLFRPKVYTNQADGCCKFQYFLEDSCGYKEDTITVQWKTGSGQCDLGFEAKNLSTLVNIYPNPAQHTLNVESINTIKPLYYEIYSLDGQIILRGVLSKTKETINLDSLSNGSYFFRCLEEDRVLEVKKFIICNP